MSTQFSTIGSGISDVGGQLDEMLKKLGMSMESAPIQTMASNNMPFSPLGNNSFISGFMQPTIQPAYNMNLNYNQSPSFQSGLITDQALPPLDPAQSAINLQNVSESLASLQYSLSNMISMSSNNSFPLQNNMLDAGSLKGTLNTFNPPMGLNGLGTSTLGQNGFYSSQLSPNPSTSTFFGQPQSSPLPDNGFMAQIDASLVYGDFDKHLVDGPPGLNDSQNNALSANSVPFEFNEAPSHVQLEINSLLDGSSDTLASSLLMEGLFDQELAEETVSPFTSQNNIPTKTKGKKSPQSKVGADARTEAFRSNSPSPVNEQPVVIPTPFVVAPVVVVNPETEKPSGPKPFSWADITKTTAPPTTAVVVSTPTATPTVATTTSTPSVTNIVNPSNNSNKNNINNKNNNKVNNNAANHNANINNPNNKAHANNKNNTNNTNNTNSANNTNHRLSPLERGAIEGESPV